MKSHTIELKTTVTRNLGTNITPVEEHNVPVTVTAFLAYYELAESSKVLISIGTYGTIVIDSRHDPESDHDYTIFVDWPFNETIFDGEDLGLTGNHSLASYIPILDNYLGTFTKGALSITTNSALEIRTAAMKALLEASETNTRTTV